MANQVGQVYVCEICGNKVKMLVAGKGHETYQTLRDRTIPFDDRVVAREVLAALGYPGASATGGAGSGDKALGPSARPGPGKMPGSR